MNLLAIIIVFFLMQNWSGARAIQQDDWLMSWNKWAGTQMARIKLPIELSTILIILLPALAAALLVQLFQSVLWGLLGLLLLLAVLLYSLGRGDFNGQIERYLDAWRAKDFQGAHQVAGEFSHGEIFEQTDSLAELQRHSVQAILYQSSSVGLRSFFGLWCWGHLAPWFIVLAFYWRIKTVFPINIATVWFAVLYIG